MPSNANLHTVSLQFDPAENQTIPSGARSEYRSKHTQLAESIHINAKLEKNIVHMETMLSQDQTPKSLRVTVKISVNQERQSSMNWALQQAQITSEKSELQALIDARKAELTAKKATANKAKDTVLSFVANGLDTLKRNDISPLSSE